MSEPFWTDAEVRRALGLPGTGDSAFYGRISTDTRTIAEGDLLVALKGVRFNAHEFLRDAFETGASGAVVSEIPANVPSGLRLYRVDDTLAALGSLAHHWRQRIDGHLIGIVGSNGKTTTKELVRAVLQSRYRTHATEGNLNNRIGVPLTLLSIPADAEAVVVEMGTNRPGEIAILTDMVQPDLAIVTSIGEEHLELLGDLDGVLREESAILEGLAPAGRGIVAEEPAALPERAREILGAARVRVAGFGPDADLRPDDGDAIEVLDDGSTRWRWRGHAVHLPLPGRFNVRNALLALGVAEELGVAGEDAVCAIAQVAVPNLRGQWIQCGGVRVLADCYNSNPPSLIAAVELLASLPSTGAKVVVLGTMREMGGASDRLHASAAQRVVERVESGVDTIVATGEFVRAFGPHAAGLSGRLVAVEDPVEAYQAIRPSLIGTETILLKASRGEQLERWLPLLQRDFGEAS